MSRARRRGRARRCTSQRRRTRCRLRSRVSSAAGQRVPLLRQLRGARARRRSRCLGCAPQLGVGEGHTGARGGVRGRTARSSPPERQQSLGVVQPLQHAASAASAWRRMRSSSSAGPVREGQDVQVEVRGEGELDIVTRLQVGRAQGDRRRGGLAAHTVAEVVVHAQVADQLGGEQVGVQAVERGRPTWDSRPDDEEAGQQLADGAGVDVAVGIAGVARAVVVVGVDRPDRSGRARARRRSRKRTAWSTPADSFSSSGVARKSTETGAARRARRRRRSRRIDGEVGGDAALHVHVSAAEHPVAGVGVEVRAQAWREGGQSSTRAARPAGSVAQGSSAP